MNHNDIRDALERMPPRYRFNGREILDFSSVRARWFADILNIPLHERINRRGGVHRPPPPRYAAWRGVRASIRRWHRRHANSRFGACD